MISTLALRVVLVLAGAPLLAQVAPTSGHVRSVPAGVDDPPGAAGRDAGNDAGVPRDDQGSARPRGVGFDIGANAR